MLRTGRAKTGGLYCHVLNRGNGRAEDWRWSSLWWWLRPAAERPLAMTSGGRPANWLELVHTPLREGQLAAMRRSVNRGTPLGEGRWVPRVASALGLEHTLRPRGRPKKRPEK